MRIWVSSPSNVSEAGLVELLKKLGFDADVRLFTDTEVGLRDLLGHTPPYPLPVLVPTVALVTGRPEEVADLRRCGYRGYIGADDDVEDLRRALGVVTWGGLWFPSGGVNGRSRAWDAT